MSANQTPWPGAEDTTLASTARAGLMGRWETITSTVAAFAFSGTGRQRKVYVPLATTALAGALSAADKAKLDALYQAYPSCRVFHTANQSIATGAVTALAFNGERFDTHAFHDPVTNNGRLTVPTGLGGLYLVGGHVQWAAGAGTRRQAAISLNNTTTYGLLDVTGAGLPDLSPVTLLRLAAGDFVLLTVFQDSGGALNVSTFANFSPEFWLVRLGD